MGYLISHGGSPVAQYSTLMIENIGVQLRHALSRYDWMQVRGLFGVPLRDCPQLSPGKAARVGDILLKAARHPNTDSDWRPHIKVIGESALRAARAGETWVWS